MLPSVFISYSSKDVEIAETIENHLLENEFNIWRDKSKIRSDWSREIANALSKSNIVLLIWSENSSNSNWVRNEWLSARALGKPIQLVITSALDKLPKPLANLEAIVVEVNENNNNNIIHSNNTQKIIDKLKEVAEFKLHQEYNYNILPHKRNIPFDPNPDFTGRDTDLMDLYLELIGNLSKLNYNKVGIVGTGGVGKTQLALEFFYRYAYAFEKGIFWIDGYDPTRWLEQIVSIARDYLEFEIPKEEDITQVEKNKRYFIEFQKYCSENGSKMLLVIDNVVHPMNLYKDNILFPGDTTTKSTLLTLGCNLLFTTRMDFENKLPNVIEHKLEMLLPNSAYELLTKYKEPTSKEEEKFAEKICKSVGYLPLALVLAQARITKLKEKITFEKYYNAIKKNTSLEILDWNKISRTELKTRHEAAVRATFEPDWEILTSTKDNGTSITNTSTIDKVSASDDLDLNIEDIQNAKKLISLLSLLPESAIIPKNRLIIYSGIENKDEFDLLEFPAESAFNLLDILNLVDILEDGKFLRIHPLLREFVYEKIQKKQKVEDLMLESISNLKKRYYDNFSFLVDEYSRERDVGDIDSILDDFKIILEWSKNERLKKSNDDPIINSIYSLYKILEQESNNLRLKERNSFISTLPSKIDKQLVFAQQIHLRATDLSQINIIQRSRDYLQRNKSSFFNVLWAKVRDKSALIRTLEHGSFVFESVAITPDGTKIVSGSSDYTVKMWDLASGGRLLNTLESHTDSVSSVAITPDGTKIVSGSWDKTIKVWDLASGGSLLNTLESHTDSVSSVAITPDGTKIVSGSWDKTIKVWDLASGGSLLNTLEGHTDAVLSVAITPDGTKIVSGSGSKTIWYGSRGGQIKVWDLASGGSLLNTLEDDNVAVLSVAITPDGTKIVSGAAYGDIKVWDLASGGSLLNTLESHTSAVFSVAITPDGTKIVCGGASRGKIKVWDLASGGSLLNTLEGHTDSVLSVAITPDGTKIVSGSEDKTIKVWDLASGGSLLNTPEGHTDSVSSVAITPDGTKIVSGSFDKTIKVWDLASGGRLVNTLEGHTSYVSSVAITPDGTKILSGSYDYAINVWDLASGDRLLKTLEKRDYNVAPKAIIPPDLVFSSVAITPDGTKIVSGSYDKTIRVWDLASGGLPLNTLEGHNDRVRSVAITPDGTKIVSGSYDKTIRVWDLASGGLPLNTLEGHTGAVSSVAITPDGTKIVSGSYDKTIKVWDLASGDRLLSTLEGHTGAVSSVAITPDGTKIVSGSEDKTIKVWELNKGLNIFTCKFDLDIEAIAVSKNKGILTIGDSNGGVYAINTPII